MPVALFVCPHCEKHAEVQVTSVTRSRPCPHCGEVVVLQVSAKDKGRRRALLVASKDSPVLPPSDAPTTGPAYDPKPLEGDVLDRMRLDPEVKAFRRRFVIGLSSLAALVVIMVIWHFVGGSVMDRVAEVTAHRSARPPEASRPVDPNALPANAVGMRRGTHPSSGQGGDSLVFEPPAVKSAVQPAASQTVASAPPVKPPSALPDRVDAQENRENGSSKVRLPMTDPRVQAAAALERFLVANNLDAMLATVADRQKVEPHIRSYLESNPLTPLDYASLTISNGAGPTGERTIVITLRDGTTREANVLREDGRSVVDWPSFVAWSDMEWAKFMDIKPAEPVLFRVYAQNEQRFDNAFADSKGLTCVKLINPNDKRAAPLFAYVERKSIVGEELDFLMREAGDKPAKLTVHLKYPADPVAKDQVWIDGLLASGWMLPRAKNTAQVSAE